MPQAIVSRYIPATNTKGSRIKAFCERGSLTISYPDHLSGQACHEYAVKLLCEKFDLEDRKKYGSSIGIWQRPKAVGQIPGGDYVHCFIALRGDEAVRIQELIELQAKETY